MTPIPVLYIRTYCHSHRLHSRAKVKIGHLYTIKIYNNLYNQSYICDIVHLCDGMCGEDGGLEVEGDAGVVEGGAEGGRHVHVPQLPLHCLGKYYIDLIIN